MLKKYIRKKSWKKVKSYGMIINPNLPLIGDEIVLKSQEEIFDRFFCLYTVSAVSYGCKRELALKWIKQERLEDSLQTNERQYLVESTGDDDLFKRQIEAMWAMFWALKGVAQLDFTKECSDNFIYYFPDIRKFEDTKDLRMKYKLRNIKELYKIFDFSYCLHWSMRQTMLDGDIVPNNILSSDVPSRRRALEWILYETEDWYDVPLDT